jgi:DNA-binding PadR family transcriptional regulator
MLLKSKPIIQKRLFIAYSDLAILVALKKQYMTGYSINKYFLEEFGYIASPSTIYCALAKIERDGLIKCIGNKNGRVYALTEQGKEVVKNIENKIKDSCLFIHKLLA